MVEHLWHGAQGLRHECHAPKVLPLVLNEVGWYGGSSCMYGGSYVLWACTMGAPMCMEGNYKKLAFPLLQREIYKGTNLLKHIYGTV
jgi:hypothetical protein